MAFNANLDAITVQFTLDITDSCSPQPYTGYYFAYITINFNGGPTLCSYTTQTNPCNLVQGNNSISFYCDMEAEANKCLYEINVRVCRCTNPLTCCADSWDTNLCFYQLYTSPYQVIYVKL